MLVKSLSKFLAGENMEMWYNTNETFRHVNLQICNLQESLKFVYIVDYKTDGISRIENLHGKDYAFNADKTLRHIHYRKRTRTYFWRGGKFRVMNF